MTLAEPGVGDVIVQLDIFPADALIPDASTTFLNVRVAVADGVVQVWRSEYGGPAVVFVAPLLAADGGPRTGWTLTTDRGVVIAGFSGGCLCGQQLGTADLWPGRRRVNTSL